MFWRNGKSLWNEQDKMQSIIPLQWGASAALTVFSDSPLSPKMDHAFQMRLTLTLFAI